MLRIFAFLFTLLALPLYASSLPSSVIFGDSLSDEGRLYAVTDNTFPPSPFFEGRFSNGPLWAEYMGVMRQNYAFSGAKSDYSNALDSKLGPLVANTGLLGQVDEYVATQPLPEDMANTQYYINIGGNDFLALVENSDTDLEYLVHETVENIINAANRLREAGAQEVMLIGLPNLADIPLSNDLSLQEQQILALVSVKFNMHLESQAMHYGYDYFDMFKLVNKIMGRPSDYGLSNVVDACFDEVAGVVCSNPDEYFFWDDIHPTTHIHQIFAGEL
jgi:outer membrane lipase/esterase